MMQKIKLKKDDDTDTDTVKTITSPYVDYDEEQLDGLVSISSPIVRSIVLNLRIRKVSKFFRITYSLVC
jgi:hypothetical protein